MVDASVFEQVGGIARNFNPFTVILLLPVNRASIPTDCRNSRTGRVNFSKLILSDSLFDVVIKL
jgi:hypothetical protein